MTKEIQQAVGKMLAERTNECICENYPHDVSEMDIASLSKKNLLSEYEVKISRQDFLKDKKKKKWAYYELKTHRVPNYFSYVCPTDLISVDEVPAYSGLFYYHDGKLTKIKSPKRIHDNPSDREEIVKKMLRLYVQRKYLGGAMLTIKNRAIREGNKARDEWENNFNSVCPACGKEGSDHDYPNYQCDLTK